MQNLASRQIGAECDRPQLIPRSNPSGGKLAGDFQKAMHILSAGDTNNLDLIGEGTRHAQGTLADGAGSPEDDDSFLHECSRKSRMK